VIETTDSKSSAEARYHIAKIQFIQKDMEGATKSCYDLINQVPAYPYWMARGNILLSDIFFEQEKLLEAKYALQILIDNYKGEDLKEVASQKLQIILKFEEKQRKDKLEGEREDIEIDMTPGDTLDVQLFQEEESVEEREQPKTEIKNKESNKDE